MDNPIPVDLGRVAQDLQIRRVQVESVVQLLDEGNTVPFITRYRKERTGNLNEVVIREIQLRVHRLRELAERKETILKAIEAQGKLNPELAAAIRGAENPKRLEDLYLPFKPKKRTKASDARDKGLEPLAVRVWNRDELLTDPVAAAQEFVSAEKGLETPEKVLEGVGHILAEAISEMAAVRDAVRKVVWKTARIATSKGEIPEGQGLEYRDYFDYSEPLSQVPPHRVLAINRGDKEGPLKIRLEVPRPELEAAFFHQLPLEGHPQAALFRTAAMDALDRLILPSMEREVRRDLTDAAEKHAVEVFARNLRSLLLQPPIPKQVVLAIDPGLRSGCKVAVLDPHGNLLDHGVVYPHAPQNRRSETKLFLKDLVGRHRVGVVAIGNGTACRETEELVAEIIAEGTQFSQGEPSPQETGEAREPGDSMHQEPGDSMHQEPGVAAVGEIETPESPPAGHHAIVEQSIATAEGRQSSASLEPEHSVPPSGLDHHELAPSGSPELSAADNSHAVRHEAPTVPELNEETLPPITGGAPEPASPEAETESDMAPTPGDGETATAPHHERSDNSEQNHALSTSTRADGETRSDEPSDASAGAEVPEAASAEQVANSVSESSAPEQGPEAVSIAGNPPVNSDKAIEAGQSDAFAAGPALVEGPAEGADASSAAPAGLETQAAAAAPAPPAEAKPPHESRRGGSGKHNHGRSRGSRPKPSASAPPPPTPPAPHAADPLLAQLAYVIVNEAGASVYSTSQIGREELPEFDATLRSAISIGRRLQDPLAELVKIEPQSIGVGLYQHDVNAKQLKESLEGVISSCVNFVGVDLNTASVPLLRHVSGLNQLTARRIVDYRKEKGPFKNRQQLHEVEGIGPATFTQAAGFLKIR